MPEYLAPGVYVEEVSFRSKSIEGVPTSTTGFVGMTRTGPVRYEGGPRTSEPRLITSFTEFERVYGGLEPLHVNDDAQEREAYLAHAARAFFTNGGQRLYVSRTYVPLASGTGVARREVGGNGLSLAWTARWPGRYGEVEVTTEVVRTKCTPAKTPANTLGVARARDGAVIERFPGTTLPEDVARGNAPLDASRLLVVRVNPDQSQSFFQSDGSPLTLVPTDLLQIVELRVRVKASPERVDFHQELGADPAQTRYIGKILQRDDPEDENSLVWLDVSPDVAPGTVVKFLPALLMITLQGNANPRLEGGRDGTLVGAADLAGKAADVDHPELKATGLEALAEIDDIAIVAAPDAGTLADADACASAADALIRHAETMRYRIAVVDAPQGSSMTEIRRFRGRFDSRHAALYHPWIEIADPLERPGQGAPPRRLLLPPSGFVAGVYARTDVERGVHKAPANEVVHGLTRFEANINKPRQDVLNPEGINAMRYFEGRGNRIWGARTMSSDPEWKYVNVRRLFAFIEHSIDRGTQWAVFEPNNSRLWNQVRQTIEDFLLVLWRDGALLGDKPEKAFFVRCDRTTMTQNDLDNGRLIALIGVAPTKPAEFVIFRIGQYTADAKS